MWVGAKTDFLPWIRARGDGRVGCSSGGGGGGGVWWGG